MPLIQFKNVSKSFDHHAVISGMSFEVKKGETLCIIGGSGSGKSVTLKLMLGLIDLDSGEILFQGKNLSRMSREEVLKMRSRIGMLFQGAALFDSLTVFENVAYPLIEHASYSEGELKRIVKEKLKLVGLTGIEEKYPAEISGGMRKRVGLARAIAPEPEVVLYDEPLAGLDPANMKRIDELIMQLQKVLQVTSVVVTHHMESAFKISNRIALLHNKKIEFIGTVDEVRNADNKTVQNFINGEIGEI